MEDLDRPREVPGAAATILRTLEAFGFEWDGQILRKSSRIDAYAQAIERLRDAGLVFPCACSRREITARGPPGIDGPIYPGTCRHRLSPGRPVRFACALSRQPSWSAIAFRESCARTWRARWEVSLPRQIFLLRALRLPVPIYAHLPVVVDAAGRKLGKSHAAAPVDPDTPLSALLRAWHFLGQAPFPEPPTNLAEFWTQARSTWNMDRVPNQYPKALSAE